MSWLKDFAGGVASSLANGLISFGANKLSTDHANTLNVKNYAQRYQLAVQDMKAAGLNPILAATSGIGGNINGVSGFAASVPSIGSEASALSSSALSRKHAANADALARSTIASNASSARKLDADAAAVNQMTNFNREYFPYELAARGQTVENARKQGKLLEAQEAGQRFQNEFVLPAMVNLYTQQGLQAASSAALNAQNSALSRANTNLLSLQGKDYKKYGISPHNITGWAAPLARLGDRVNKLLKNRSYLED